MKYVFCFLLIISFSNGISQEREYGRSFDLGYGFVEKHYSVKNPPGHWEAIANYTAIFFNGRDLGNLSGFKISPSGRHAIYGKDEGGKLYIFYTKQQKEKSLSLKEYCYPNNPRWNETQMKLLIGCLKSNDEYYDLTINLTKPAVI
ncbi:hypothetical protein OO007_20235 [Cocleimonas sp. KMM 6892]|uniref:hypothetical protein n=1 Tax=unclassified Cocleimonas TaxID=2639732 RepID=UPI002DBAE77E|nr:MULTISPECIES: hypothetical protein [unclassified Cocleimonas]MEB8434574.1 hypothetical protein [Cocleimonas sp. KMM 6892]MEC4717515.1 hypothetical protein [Cocleimonas sp. KMM 6895]MEC4746844.1 hypothetical protein [Cocleimonas sp. KMM 6896]